MPCLARPGSPYFALTVRGGRERGEGEDTEEAGEGGHSPAGRQVDLGLDHADEQHGLDERPRHRAQHLGGVVRGRRVQVGLAEVDGQLRREGVEHGVRVREHDLAHDEVEEAPDALHPRQRRERHVHEGERHDGCRHLRQRAPACASIRLASKDSIIINLSRIDFCSLSPP